MLRKEGKLTSLVLFVTLVLASSVGADASAAEASAVIGAPVETLALNKALATGNFECRVIGIDPPDGTGVPIGFATIGLRSLLGVVSTGGEILANADLGSGDGIDATCQALTEQLLGSSRALGCTAGPIRTFEFTGGNYTEKTRTFDFVCVNAERRVLDTIGALFGEVITIPSAAQVIRRTGLERRDPAAPQEARIPVQASPRMMSTNVKP